MYVIDFMQLIQFMPLIQLNVYYSSHSNTNNKCIGDDTKAAPRQSLNCIKNKKIKYGEKRFSVYATYSA